MKTIDKDKSAKWFVNRTEYRFPHGLRAGVYFEPGEPTKVLADDWIKGQTVIEEIEDPDGPLPEKITGATPLVQTPGVTSTGPVVTDKK